jgi:uracil-DNA glycosylase
MNASKTHPPERDNDDKRKPDVIPFSNPPRSMRAAVALCGTTPRGKRRMHKTPAQREIDACHYWLEREIETVKPHVLVALGATALKALREDKSLRLQDALGKAIEHDGRVVVATWHPSYGLRTPDADTRERVYADIVDALRRAGEIAHQAAGRKRS